MSYRDILVYLDSDATKSSFIDAAVSFALSQNAYLTGLHVIDIPAIPDYATANLPHEIIENHRNMFLKQAEETESAFKHACEAAGLSFEWRCVEGETGSAVIQAGRYTDLVMLAGGAGAHGPHHASLLDRIVLESGRPVMVVPEKPANSAIGTQIMLAWNARREAVRAAHDALPLLLDANWVKVVSINPKISDNAHGELPGADFARHLSRHGAKAEAQSVTMENHDAGKRLLNWAAEEKADLIVMGAYGHARWRELVLGGVTAHVLRHTNLPVLMSH